MVNAKDAVDDEVHQKSSCHKSISSNLRYRIANDTAMDKKFDALLDKGDIEKKNNDKLSSSEDSKDVMSNQKQLVKNVPELNANILTNIPSNVFQPI